MNNLDLRTPIIYVLTFVIVVLLIVLKKQDDANKNNALKEKLEQAETGEQSQVYEFYPNSRTLVLFHHRHSSQICTTSFHT